MRCVCEASLLLRSYHKKLLGGHVWVTGASLDKDGLENLLQGCVEEFSQHPSNKITFVLSLTLALL